MVRRNKTLKYNNLTDMQNKLQELTDKLYNEGLSKGKKEGEIILEQARKQAEEIIAESKKEAGAIVGAAKKEAEELRTNVESDLKMAADQTLAALRQEIAKLITAKIADGEIKTALSQADFVKEMITAVVKGFNAGGAADIELLLPESLGAQLVPFIEKGLKESVGGGISVKLSKKTQGGFTIAPKDGGYYISFTEETFKELIGGYLRPATKKILFG